MMLTMTLAITLLALRGVLRPEVEVGCSGDSVGGVDGVKVEIRAVSISWGVYGNSHRNLGNIVEYVDSIGQ